MFYKVEVNLFNFNNDIINFLSSNKILMSYIKPISGRKKIFKLNSFLDKENKIFIFHICGITLLELLYLYNVYSLSLREQIFLINETTGELRFLHEIGKINFNIYKKDN